jgi:hypothetical protein
MTRTYPTLYQTYRLKQTPRVSKRYSPRIRHPLSLTPLSCICVFGVFSVFWRRSHVCFSLRFTSPWRHGAVQVPLQCAHDRPWVCDKRSVALRQVTRPKAKFAVPLARRRSRRRKPLMKPVTLAPPAAPAAAPTASWQHQSRVRRKIFSDPTTEQTKKTTTKPTNELKTGPQTERRRSQRRSKRRCRRRGRRWSR